MGEEAAKKSGRPGNEAIHVLHASVPVSQVIEMPEHNPGQMGGTMRLGKRRTLFKTKDSVLSKWWWMLGVRIVRYADPALSYIKYCTYNTYS